MAIASESMRSLVVYLDNLTDFDAVMIHRWFMASQPERLTCRPISQRSDDEVILQHQERLKKENQQDFAVRRISDNCLMGRVSYFDLNPRNRTAEIGFMIAPEFRDKGYGFEAMTILLEHLFRELGLNKVMAQTGEFNQPSIALLQKLGFKQDGRLREHHELEGKMYDDLLFSILADEFIS